MLSTIDDKIKAVKVDVDLQFAAIDRRIDVLENNMRSLSTLDGMDGTSGSFVNQSVSNDELTIIVSNLKLRKSTMRIRYESREISLTPWERI